MLHTTRFRLSIALLALALALPGAASASTTVSRSGDVITITGDDTASRLVTVAYFTHAQVQDDLGGAVTAGAGCTALAANSVDCGDFGPAARIVANLGGGDDYYKWAAISVPQEIDAGAGNDTIEAGEGNDSVRGGAGNDDLTGGRGDDTVDGGDGNDKVDGWDGSDTVIGGPGQDNLLGDGGTIYSGGNDTIQARDGEADAVDCGGGADRAVVDTGDTVNACATVDRSAAGTGQDPGAGATDLSVDGSVGTLPRIGKLLGGSSIALRLTPTKACVARVAIAVTATEAKRLRIGKKVLVLGTSRATPLKAGGATKVTVALSRAYRAKLRKAERISASLVVACADAAGGAFSGALAVRLKT
jgi:Ca2+-binding RTX toxin-like protein